MVGERLYDRRTVLRGAATTAPFAAAGITLESRPAVAAPPDDGLIPTRMAMHVQACFSEGSGSMQAHLAEAARTGIDVIWWTEHDHRMVARRLLTDVHFNGLTEWAGATSVTWRSSLAGEVDTSSAWIVTKPTSPNDVGDSAMQLSVASSGSVGGTRTVTAHVKNFGLNTSIDGTTVLVDVRPVDVGEDAWFDIVMETSYRPAAAGRPAGQYRLRYRVGGGRPVGTVTEVEPLDGLIVLEAPPDAWTTLELDPVADFALLWSDIDFRDAALTTFAFAVTSRNQVISTVVVDALRFDRVRKGPAAVLDVQRDLMAHYAPLYPTVVQHQGLEVSENTPHLNWFGEPEIWPASHPGNFDIGLAISTIQAAGGVASYNHPFGTSGAGLSSTQRVNKRRSLTATFVEERVFGADVIEVGYTGGRAGMTQSDYISMWDVLSRNLVFATGVGVTDDHDGHDWTDQKWRHFTGVWAPNTELASLQGVLRAGRAWFADLALFTGTIDVLGAGFVPMGSVGQVDTDQASLDVYLSDLPAGWRIGVISGVADEAGSSVLDPVVTSRAFSEFDLVEGVLSLKVSSTTSRFHRVVLRDGDSVVRAYSNPLWLLRSTPTAVVPESRWVEPPPPPIDPQG
ncbi:MAG: hypothetical protein LH630_07870 [Actinomycetia bacterium]|nr:hypothetical protein [Actinomycetes bacterium]